MNSKKNIAIVSVLKPVDDVRSYYKMAKTLDQTDNFNITLIGFPTSSKTQNESKNIRLNPLPLFSRIGFRRIITPLLVFKKLIKVKPQLIIVNTYELLIVIILHQILFGGKIVYDLQENYFRNLIYQSNYPIMFKYLLGFIVRSKEWVLSPFIDHFILAEKGYAQELNFVKDRFTILENKCIKLELTTKEKSENKITRFLFSGNLSENSGVNTAIDFYKKVAENLPTSELVIIGHCPTKKFYNSLNSISHKGVLLRVSDTPIEYSEIVSQMQISDFGIVSYDVNPSNENCMPTKVYEYLGYSLPIISEVGTVWSDYISNFDLGVQVDFKNFDEKIIANELLKFNRPSKRNKIPEVYWENEKPKLLTLIEQLTKAK